MGLDEVANRLQISRGNASMSLKELRNWGVIQKVPRPGDRRDFYIVEPDVFRMFFRIANERKRREFDPGLEALRNTLHASTSMNNQVRHRLTEMEELFSTADRLAKIRECGDSTECWEPVADSADDYIRLLAYDRLGEIGGDAAARTLAATSDAWSRLKARRFCGRWEPSTARRPGH